MMDWHLLVVDDQARHLEAIAKCLGGASFRLDLADNPERAWQMLHAPGAAYDLIILDSTARGMKGTALQQQIHAETRFSAIPVVVLTAAPDQPEALSAGVSAALAAIAQRHDTRHERRHPSADQALLHRAEFSFTSLADVEALTRLLSSLCPEPGKVALGLSELLLNAVEHSNLGIGYQEKSRLRREDEWDAELARRLALPEYRERRATVRVERRAAEIVFTITDAGDGFLWQDYLQTDPLRAFDPNGRGIALARQVSFARLEYPGSGNVVIATVANSPADPGPAADILRS